MYKPLAVSASFFKIKLNVFLDTLIQNKLFKIMKINIFQGELTDISAKKEALLAVTNAFVLAEV